MGIFFNNLKSVFQRYPQLADGSRIFNLDETGTSTVPNTQKVVTKKGAKQVNTVTGRERGCLVTCCIITANGTFLPPAMVFPRTHFKNHMLGFPGTLGLATPSEWMNQELFVKVLEHVIKYSNCTKDNPILLIFDNHESHLPIQAVDMAKDNGIIMLTIPPHQQQVTAT